MPPRWTRSRRRSAERRGLRGADACERDALAEHRRQPEGVRSAAGVPLTAVGEPQSKWCRRGRERIRDVDVAGADPDQIVVVQCGERNVGCAEVMDGDRGTALEKRLED